MTSNSRKWIVPSKIDSASALRYDRIEMQENAIWHTLNHCLKKQHQNYYRFEHYEKTRGFVPNSILTMQRRPAIATAFMSLNQAILYEGTVSEELKMLISLIASQAAGCRYCQAHMANLSSI